MQAVLEHVSKNETAFIGGSLSGAKEAAEKLAISVEGEEKARPRLKPVKILLALCGG